MTIRWLAAFIDMPADTFAAGTRFWLDITGSRVSPFRGEHEEFATIIPPNGDPYLRVQRLGADDPGASARAHLDIACGDRIDDVAAEHEKLGATNLGQCGYWVTMRDPSGLPYCLTPRDPITGQPPG